MRRFILRVFYSAGTNFCGSRSIRKIRRNKNPQNFHLVVLRRRPFVSFVPVLFSSLGYLLKCYYDEKMLFSFTVDSDFMFGKNAPCQLSRLNFKNKSDFFNYDFSFKLSAINRFCSSRVAFRELDREKK